MRFLDVIDAVELNEDPRFASNAVRIRNLPELVEILNGYLRKETTAHWLEKMENAHLPAGPVNDILQMHSDPQVLAREMIVEVDHPTAGQVKTIGHPVKFSRTPANVDASAPLLGQHTRDVLSEVGYSDLEIQNMIDADAVIAA